MDSCAHTDLISIEQALSHILSDIAPLQEVELLDLSSSLDRILAETLFAPISVPGHDNAAMDGYAVRRDDCPGVLSVIGSALAGHPFNDQVAARTAVLITTGAVIPEGADAVVMKENTLLITDHADSQSTLVQINHMPKLSEHIRRTGEDIAQGNLVLSAAKRISALDIGLLASLGVDKVKVIRRPRIAVLTTGDELLLPGTPLELGKIYDSNRPMLKSLLSRMTVEVRDLGVIPDNPETLLAVFTEAMNWADVVISTGGVSVGEADFTKNIFTQLGEITFWRIAMKPGKPFAFGRLFAKETKNISQKNIKCCWLFGLPGNPVSAAVTYHQLVVPGLRHLAGENLNEQGYLSARTQVALKKQPGRTDFQRGILSFNQGIAQVTSAGSQSSAVLSAMARANCYIKLDAEQGNIAAGEMVKVVPFDAFIR